MLLSDFLQRGRSALDPLYPEAEARACLAGAEALHILAEKDI